MPLFPCPALQVLTLDPPQVHHALAWAVGDPQSRRPDGSPNIECRRPASNATGTPIVGTPTTAPSPVPTSCSSHIATTGSSVELMSSEDAQERTLDLATPPRPTPEPVMRIREDPGV